MSDKKLKRLKWLENRKTLTFFEWRERYTLGLQLANEQNTTLKDKCDKYEEALNRLDDLVHPCDVDDDMNSAYYTVKQALANEQEK
tara:strand:- start:307 stop:564 length:258 start_codon:yes stop_codon:yes gene_type:complete